MIDIKLLRNNWEKTIANIQLRNKEFPALEKFKEIDKIWRENATKVQELNTRKNELSVKVGELIKAKASADEISKVKDEVLNIKNEIDAIQEKTNDLETQLKMVMFSIPNILDDSHNVMGEKNLGVPSGKDENDNIEVVKSLSPTKFDFEPLPHWDLGVKLNLLDFERGRKISGERMYVLTGDGARLMRALRNFTLDLHINEAGYTEVLPPIIMNKEPLFGLGKLPLFEDDMYQTIEHQFLAGTEEHPLTAMYMDEVLNVSDLPLKLTSSSTSYRKEAGSGGKDTKGILRVHQFYNTEMVNISTPEQSWDLLGEMTKEAEKVLKILNIPYRIIKLCGGDIGDAASTTYDLEVWMPSSNSYREISSCSNVLDYQARGLSIKYFNPATKKNEFAHTLNGTGTSLNRLWIAIVENFQQKDGSIIIPTALRPYLQGQETITKK